MVTVGFAADCVELLALAGGVELVVLELGSVAFKACRPTSGEANAIGRRIRSLRIIFGRAK